jgi:hypothetical protein
LIEEFLKKNEVNGKTSSASFDAFATEFMDYDFDACIDSCDLDTVAKAIDAFKRVIRVRNSTKKPQILKWIADEGRSAVGNTDENKKILLFASYSGDATVGHHRNDKQLEKEARDLELAADIITWFVINELTVSETCFHKLELVWEKTKSSSSVKKEQDASQVLMINEFNEATRDCCDFGDRSRSIVEKYRFLQKSVSHGGATNQELAKWIKRRFDLPEKVDLQKIDLRDGAMRGLDMYFLTRLIFILDLIA